MKPHSRLNGLCCLLAVLLLLSLSSSALAAERGIDMDCEGSIVLSLFYESRPVSGGDLRLYKVGEVEQDDGSCFFRLSDAFGARVLDQSALDSPELVGQLAGDSDLNTLEYRSTTFGADGKATFSGVSPGLYLLTQTKAASGFQLVSPILVSVPYYVSDEEGYSYDVDASVKPALERHAQPSPLPTPKPPLPQTGQLNWPVPVMAGLGLCFIVAGVLLLFSDKRRTGP